MEVPVISIAQMREWNCICQAVANRLHANLLFVNESSMGLELSDGRFLHVYIDEVEALLKQEVNT